MAGALSKAHTAENKKRAGMVAGILGVIQSYSQQVLRGLFVCDLPSCPGCGRSGVRFRRHDRRARWFRYVVDRLVSSALSHITRFACESCGHRFTHYPPWAFPHKRYVLTFICERAERYLTFDSESYRSAVCEQRLAICYGSTNDGAIDDRQLHASTLHRWIGSLGRLTVTLRSALRLIRERSASSTIHRHVLVMPARKYRTAARKTLLSTAARLVAALPEYRSIFQAEIFPSIATAAAWT